LNDLVSFRFVSQFTDFVSFRRIFFRFAVFRFYFVSHFTGTPDVQLFCIDFQLSYFLFRISPEYGWL